MPLLNSTVDTISISISNQCSLIAVINYSLNQRLSTGVPWNLRVLPVASKGSATSSESNRVIGTKWHLWPPDVFSGLLVHPKCILQSGLCPMPRWGLTVLP